LEVEVLSIGIRNSVERKGSGTKGHWKRTPRMRRGKRKVKDEPKKRVIFFILKGELDKQRKRGHRGERNCVLLGQQRSAKNFVIKGGE